MNMSIDECYYYLIIGIIHAIEDLKYEMLEHNSIYNTYIIAIQNLLNSLEVGTRNIVIHELNRKSRVYFYS